MKYSYFAALALLGASGSLFGQVFPGNGGVGYGGPVGGGSLSVVQQGSTSVLDFDLTRGGGGNLNDHLTIYIDSVSGGFGDTTLLTDFGDDGRSRISAPGNIIFPAGFAADYAIDIFANSYTFAGTFGLVASGSFTFIQDNGLVAASGASSSNFTFSLDIANIGLNPGDSFQFVSVYGWTGGQSDESLNNLPTGTNFDANTIDMGTLAVTPNTVSTIPEPAAMSMLFGAMALAVAAVRRRKQ